MIRSNRKLIFLYIIIYLPLWLGCSVLLSSIKQALLTFRCHLRDNTLLPLNRRGKYDYGSKNSDLNQHYKRTLNIGYMERTVMCQLWHQPCNNINRLNPLNIDFCLKPVQIINYIFEISLSSLGAGGILACAGMLVQVPLHYRPFAMRAHPGSKPAVTIYNFIWIDLPPFRLSH